MHIEILVHETFQNYIDLSKLQRLAERILSSQQMIAQSELSIVITDNEKMRELNKHYLGEDRPTDVLAFSVEESISTSEVPFIQPPNGILHLGEIIICYPQALTQAREHSHSADREITLLLIHGILHLLGFDHNTPESEDQMKTREREMLKCLWREES